MGWVFVFFWEQNGWLSRDTWRLGGIKGISVSRLVAFFALLMGVWFLPFWFSPVHITLPCICELRSGRQAGLLVARILDGNSIAHL